MSFKPGSNVGPYQIIEQLGQGGWLPFIRHTMPLWIGM